MPTGVQWPPSPVYITTTVTINARDLIKRGSTLVYYVTVRNTSDIDYVLDPCPDYNEFLGKKDLYASYRLNCAPVGHIGSPPSGPRACAAAAPGRTWPASGQGPVKPGAAGPIWADMAAMLGGRFAAFPSPRVPRILSAVAVVQCVPWRAR